MKGTLVCFIDRHLHLLARDIERLDFLAGCPEFEGDISFFRELSASSADEQNLLCLLGGVEVPARPAKLEDTPCAWELLECAWIERHRRELLWRTLGELWSDGHQSEEIARVRTKVRREAENLDDKFRLLARAVLSPALS